MLKEDFIDDILDTSKNENRRYAIKDSSGAILYEDVTIEDTTDYLQEGSLFGAKELNETNAAVNDLSADVNLINSGYETYKVLCTSASGTITLADSIYNYETLMLENSNYGIAYVSPFKGQTYLRANTQSISSGFVVFCNTSWTVSNNGKTLTPDYNYQMNFNGNGMQYYTDNASFTWNIIGLKHLE